MNCCMRNLVYLSELNGRQVFDSKTAFGEAVGPPAISCCRKLRETVRAGFDCAHRRPDLLGEPNCGFASRKNERAVRLSL